MGEEKPDHGYVEQSIGAERFVLPHLRQKRLTKDEYLMSLAREASKRSTCPKRRVGAVVSYQGRVLSTGYNGSIPGQPHCDAVGCMLEAGKCIRTVHAEINALLWASMLTFADSVYVTVLPCWSCFKAIATTTIREVVYEDEGTPDKQVLEAALSAGIKLRHLPRIP